MIEFASGISVVGLPRKLAGIVWLNENGYRVPPTYISNPASFHFERSSVCTGAAAFYARVIHAHGQSGAFCSRGELNATVSRLVTNARALAASMYGVIQPIIDPVMGGAFLVSEELSVCEAVYGHPVVLLRNGVWQKRWVWKRQDGVLLRRYETVQRLCSSVVSERIQKSSVVMPVNISDDALTTLRAIERLNGQVLAEWCIDRSGRVYWLDAKKIEACFVHANGIVSPWVSILGTREAVIKTVRTIDGMADLTLFRQTDVNVLIAGRGMPWLSHFVTYNCESGNMAIIVEPESSIPMRDVQC